MTAFVFRPKRRKNGKVWRSRLYSARYRLAGQTRTTTVALHVTDRQLAETKLRELVQDLEREAAGIIPPKRVRVANECNMDQHVKAYCLDLRARRKDDEYVTMVEKRLTKLVEDCAWRGLADVTGESFQT